MNREQALRAVRGLQRYDEGLVKQTLIPRHSRALERAGHAVYNSPRKRFWIKMLPVDKLTSGQNVLHYPTLRKYLKKTERRKIHAMYVDGQYLLWDGNHRTTAAIYLGKKKLRCVVWY